MRSAPQNVVAASAALCTVALLKGCVVGVPAGMPPRRFSRRLQLSTPFTYASPAPVLPTAAPIPPAPIVLRPLVAPLIQGTLWRVHNGLAAASNSLLGTGIPYAGPLDTSVQVAFAPGALPPLPSADAFQGTYRDQRNFVYEGYPNSAGAVNYAPGRDHFNYEEPLGHPIGDFPYDTYKPKAFPLPPPPNSGYPLNEQLLQQPQQRMLSSNNGQQQYPASY